MLLHLYCRNSLKSLILIYLEKAYIVMKQTSIVFALILLLLLPVAGSLPAQTNFQKTYGTTDTTLIDIAKSVWQTDDKGYIIAGNISGSKSGIVKIDSSGNTLWSKTYQIGSTSYPFAQKIYPTSDGGYIAGGHTVISGKLFQFYILKVDSLGSNQWVKHYGGSSSFGIEFLSDFIPASDGGYISVGRTSSYGKGNDFYVVKSSSTGTKLWDKAYGASVSGLEDAKSVCEMPAGNFIVAGFSNNFTGTSGLSSAYFVKIGIDGTLLWYKSYDLDTNSSSSIWSVRPTSDGGLIFAGNTVYTASGLSDIFLLKTDSLGVLQWSKTYGGSNNEMAYSVLQTADKGYVIAGETSGFGKGKSDFYLIKTDSMGGLQWSDTYGTPGGNEIAYSVINTSDGGYMIAGSTTSGGIGGTDVYLVKTDAHGNSLPKNCTEKTVATLVTNVNTVESVPSGGIVTVVTTGTVAATSITPTVASPDLSSVPITRPIAVISPDATICRGSSTTLSANGGDSYLWTPSTGLSNDTITMPFASPQATLLYTVKASNTFCFDSALVTVVVNPIPTASATTNNSNFCKGGSTVLSASGGTSYEWTPAFGLSNSTIAGPVASPDSSVVYKVRAYNGECSDLDSVRVIVYPIPIPVAGGSVSICQGSGVQLTAGNEGIFYLWSPVTGLNKPNISNPFATPHATTTYTVTASNGLCTGSSTVTVWVNPLAYADFTYQGNTFINTSGGADSYFWEFGDGDTSTLFSPNHFYASGVFRTMLVAGNSCNTDTSIQIITSTTTGIIEVMNEDSVLIYPNPNNGSFYLQISTGFAEIKLMDSFGRVLYEQIIEGTTGKHNISIFDTAKGIYSLTVNSNKGIITKKIIVL